MNRTEKKILRYLESGSKSFKELEKRYPGSIDKVMKWKRYRDNKGSTPEPWECRYRRIEKG